MIDLETMGQGPDAAIVAIGAVEFDRERRETGDCFSLTIDLESAVRSGGVMDASTVLWWMQQSEEARQALNGKADIAKALASFSGWLRGRADLTEVRIWGNGSDFDNVILANAYRRLLLPAPWKFWNNRCYRTWKNEHRDVSMVRLGTHHNALDDAMSQAMHMLKAPHDLPEAA
jgi:exodeoxyribonuclease VIII